MIVKKRNAKRDTRQNTDVAFHEMWVKKTARGKKCSLCKTHIYGGEYSLRYMQEDAKSVKNKSGITFRIEVERAICVDCAIKNMEKMITALKTPMDEEAYGRALEREEKGSSRNSEW